MCGMCVTLERRFPSSCVLQHSSWLPYHRCHCGADSREQGVCCAESRRCKLIRHALILEDQEAIPRVQVEQPIIPNCSDLRPRFQPLIAAIQYCRNPYLASCTRRFLTLRLSVSELLRPTAHIHTRAVRHSLQPCMSPCT